MLPISFIESTEDEKEVIHVHEINNCKLLPNWNGIVFMCVSSLLIIIFNFQVQQSYDDAGITMMAASEWL